jgi:threonine/homoserine/homoserine lactone efflux protein
MLPSVLGDLLPAALGVALSPVPIIAVVLMLSSARGRTQGPAFAAGWVLALAVVSVVLGLLVGTATGDDGPSPVVAVVKIAFGLLFLALAVKQWRGRPAPGEQAETPGWMASIPSLSTGRTAAIGAALAGLNPKNLALTAAASATIGQSGLDATGTAVATTVFVLLASVTVLGAVLASLVAPTASAGALERIRTFMSVHNTAIMLTLLLVLGAKLVGDGLAGL